MKTFKLQNLFQMAKRTKNVFHFRFAIVKMKIENRIIIAVIDGVVLVYLRATFRLNFKIEKMLVIR